MLVSDRTRLTNLMSELSMATGGKDLPPNVQGALTHIVTRLNQCLQDIILQLNSRPLIYVVDPRTNPTVVKGARPGDICVFKNTEGDVEVMQF